MPRQKAVTLALFLATAYVPTLAAQHTYGAAPGALNFTQGQVNIDGRPLSADPSSATHQLQVGQTLATANGSADLLLASGALLRVGANSTVRMVAADAGRTEVQLEQGRANVSVNVVRAHDLLLVDMPEGQTQVLSPGLYTFNTATHTVRVFNGEAYAFPGTDMATDVKPITVKESHEIMLGGDRAKPARFDRDMADDDLLPWTGPKETRAVLADDGARHDGGGGWAGENSEGSAAYAPGASSFSGGYGYGDPYFGYSPYAWGPYGFYGYPFFGVGFGFWGGGFYRGGVYRGIPPLRGAGGLGGVPRGGVAGASAVGRPAVGGFAGGHSLGSGGFHGGGGHH